MLVLLFWFLGVPAIISVICTPWRGSDFLIQSRMKAVFEYTTSVMALVGLIMVFAYFEANMRG